MCGQKVLYVKLKTKGFSYKNLSSKVTEKDVYFFFLNVNWQSNELSAVS